MLASSCAPGAPKGVDKAVLDDAVGRAIGDPNTCVLIGQAGKVVYRFGTNVVCGRKMPACAGGQGRTVGDLLDAATKRPVPMTSSCPSNRDGSRMVAWASGAIEGRDLVYAAAMEGEHVPPGVVIADKLDTAFARAGLQPKS